MNLVWHNLKKDIRRFRLFITAWLTALALLTAMGILFPASWNNWLVEALVAVGLPAVLLALMIHQDPLGDARSFWLTRPISRRTLLAGKVFFAGLIVMLPVLLHHLLVLTYEGWSTRLLLLAAPEAFIKVLAITCLVAVLAAFTSKVTTFLIVGICCLVGAIATANVLVPGCISHSQHIMRYGIWLLQPQKLVIAGVTVLLGSSMLAWQYMTRMRMKKIAIVLALSGALCIALIQYMSMRMNIWHAQKAFSAEAASPCNAELTIRTMTSCNCNGEPGFTTTFAVHNQREGTAMKIMAGDVSLTPSGGGAYTGSLVYAYDSSLKNNLLVAVKRDIGNCKDINLEQRDAGPLTSVLNGTLIIANSNGYNACIGKKVAITGQVVLAVLDYKMEGCAPLKRGACLTFDSTRACILSVDRKNNMTEIKIRRKSINLAFAERNDDMANGLEDHLWGDERLWFLSNRKAAEVAFPCGYGSSSSLQDLLPVVSHSCGESTWSFSSGLTDAWLQDAELVCFKCIWIGSCLATFEAKDFQMPSDPRSEKASSCY